ncbi:MAG: hypothetical protein NVSMB19_01730 [Vulcanimicrobiaceae bacterium]
MAVVRIPPETATSTDFRRRAAPAIFLIDDTCNVVHAFGSAAAWLDAAGHLAPSVATTARNLITNRFEDGGTSAGLADGVTVRLMYGESDACGLHCILVEKLRTRDLLGAAVTRYQISPRETQVLQHILAGEGTSAIAEALQIAETTAGDHIKNIARKTGARSRGQIVARILGFL